MKFKFVGEYLAPNKKALVEEKTVRGNDALSMNFGVRADHDTAYVELFASKQDVLYSYKNKEKMEIAWEDRLDPEVVKSAGSKYYLNFGQREEFISQYDEIQRLVELLDGYSGRIAVTGDIRRSYYDGKWYDHYSVRNVSIPKEEEKSGLNFTAEIIFNRDSADITDWQKEKIMTVNAYVEQYIDKEHPKALVPISFVLNASRLDPANEIHAKQIKLREFLLLIKKKGYFKMGWECRLKNGAEEVTLKEEDLTDYQRMLLECEGKTMDDFRPRGQMFGERKTEYRLLKPVGYAPYDNGNVEYGTDEETEDQIYHPSAQVASSSELEAAFGLDKKETAEEIADLFG